MASREWFLTKLVGSLLGLLLLISSSIGAAQILMDIKGEVKSNTEDIESNDVKVEKHIDGDANKFESINDDNRELREKIHAVEVQNGRIESALNSILLGQQKTDTQIMRLTDKIDGLYNPDHGEK